MKNRKKEKYQKKIEKYQKKIKSLINTENKQCVSGPSFNNFPQISKSEADLWCQRTNCDQSYVIGGFCKWAPILSVNVGHWNPHYQCFGSGGGNNPNCCLEKVINYINDDNKKVYDFFNVITLEANTDQLVRLNNSYKFIGGKPTDNKGCGYDQTTILYNKNKWFPIGMSVPSDNKNIGMQDSYAYTCFVGNPTDAKADRILLGQIFKSLNNNDTKILVIGAHFGHSNTISQWEKLNQFIDTIEQYNNFDYIILLADTNLEINDSDPSDPNTPKDVKSRNNYILNTLKANRHFKNISDPYLSCCWQNSNAGQTPSATEVENTQQGNLTKYFDIIATDGEIKSQQTTREVWSENRYKGIGNYQTGGWIKRTNPDSCKNIPTPSTCCNFSEMHAPITGTIYF